MWTITPPCEPGYYWFVDTDGIYDIINVSLSYENGARKLIYSFFTDTTQYTQKRLDKRFIYYDEKIEEKSINMGTYKELLEKLKMEK